MNINKVQLGVELGLKEQTALKCIQFTTQYLLKKAQYRLLNPLHSSLLNLSQLNQHSQLMAQLNTYSIPKPNIPSKITNVKQSQQIQFQHYIPQKSIQISQQKPKDKQKPINDQQKQRQKQKQQQKTPSSSVSQYDHVQFQRTSSQIINDRFSKQSVSSKKSRNKFQKVIKTNKKATSQTFPQQIHNFKKIKPPPIQKQQTVNNNKNEKKFVNEFSESDSDDSFENFPLPSQQKDKNNKIQREYLNNQEQLYKLSINKQDLKSYRSSILSQKKVDFDIVSQHPSQLQISILDESQIIPKQIKQIEQGRENINKSDQIELINKIQSKQPSNQKIKQSIDKYQHLRQSQKQLYPKQNQIDSYKQTYSQQQIYQSTDSHKQSQIKTKEQKDKSQSLNQIRKNLLKLQSFDLQQQILIKKILKIWNQQSPTLNTLQNTQWHQLNLPKPSLKYNTHLYAQLIE